MPCKLCEQPVLARGLCRNHYMQAKRNGTINQHAPRELRPRKWKPLIDRMNEKFVIAASGCWEWTAHKNGDGYGLVWLGTKQDGKAMLAHRAMYESHKRKLSSAEMLCHHCDNPSCINPDHMFVGTRGDNIRDCIAKGRKPLGEESGRAKLTAEQVIMIKSSVESSRSLAGRYGVSASQVSRIKSGLRWSWLSAGI